MSDLHKFRQELAKTAKTIVTPGKGILAADESIGTIGKRFSKIKVANEQVNRTEYRELLFRTDGIEKFISGVILYDETFWQKDANGVPLIDILKKKGVIPGIKVDLGTRDIPFSNGEKYTQGFDELGKRCELYYNAGARFAKWRCVIKIGVNEPSELAIKETAWNLARYAAICQKYGLCPIVEPEVLIDGTHNILRCLVVSERVFSEVYNALNLHRVYLEGTLLKPNMITPGKECKEQVSPQEIANATITCLARTVPPAVPGIVFLSGGQTEEEATINLNTMNIPENKKRCPWQLSFSFGRALQASCLDAWQGKKENVKNAQKVFLSRAKANGDAQIGKYAGDAATAASKGSLYEKGYVY